MTTDREDGRRVSSLVLAGVLVVAVVAAVLLFGVERAPDLPDLAEVDGPTPPARIAWTEHDGGETCLHLASPDGTVTEPWCGEPGGDLLGWEGDGVVLLQLWEVEPTVRAVDVETGASTTRPADSGEGTALHHPEEPVQPARDDGGLVVEHGGVEVWRTDAPASYEIVTTVASPDGTWVALVDNAERLLVVEADGGSRPRVWAHGVPPQVPVWEG